MPGGRHRLQRLRRDRQPVADAGRRRSRRDRGAAPSPRPAPRRSSGHPLRHRRVGFRQPRPASLPGRCRRRGRSPPRGRRRRGRAWAARAARAGCRPSAAPGRLPARAGAADGHLDRLRRVGEAADAALRRGQHRHPAGLARPPSPSARSCRSRPPRSPSPAARARRSARRGRGGSAPGAARSAARARSRPHRRRGRPCGCPRPARFQSRDWRRRGRSPSLPAWDSDSGNGSDAFWGCRRGRGAPSAQFFVDRRRLHALVRWRHQTLQRHPLSTRAVDGAPTQPSLACRGGPRCRPLSRGHESPRQRADPEPRRGRVSSGGPHLSRGPSRALKPRVFEHVLGMSKLAKTSSTSSCSSSASSSFSSRSASWP